jgi:dTDP-4-amino-4,6-dideoxygalactose transaminase
MDTKYQLSAIALTKDKAMKVPLLDLKAQYQAIKSDVHACLNDLCESQQFILGEPVDRMEKALAHYCQAPYAVGVSSGSDALLISLMAAGIGAGHQVLTTPFTFFATAGAIARVGAQPVFVDIDEDTFNLSPDLLLRTLANMPNGSQASVKAVIPVHLYGQMADMDPIMQIARQYGLVVIEDAAQAIGAEYKGRRAGSIGDFGCFSFFPSKNLGAFGDGGLVTAGSAENDNRLRMMRMHGMQPKYYHHVIGGNFRLDALQAAVVSVKLKYLDSWTAARQTNAAVYRRFFVEAGLQDRVRLPVEKENRHIYNQFVIRVEQQQRDALRQYLAEQGIGSEIYYPLPLHLQTCFADLGYKPGAFPISEQCARQSLALPIFPELTEQQLAYVVERIKTFFSRK